MKFATFLFITCIFGFNSACFVKTATLLPRSRNKHTNKDSVVTKQRVGTLQFTYELAKDNKCFRLTYMTTPTGSVWMPDFWSVKNVYDSRPISVVVSTLASRLWGSGFAFQSDMAYFFIIIFHFYYLQAVEDNNKPVFWWSYISITKKRKSQKRKIYILFILGTFAYLRKVCFFNTF